MSYVKLQIKAAATAFLLFAVASFMLFLLVRGVGNVAAAFFPSRLPNYAPMATIGAVLNLQPLIALGAGVLLAVALVLIFRSAFLDRAVYMLVSMLTLVLASSIGIVAGFGGYLAITEHRLLVPPGVVPAAIAFAIILGLSLCSLDGLRRSIFLRLLLIPALAIGAPILLMYGG
jgi:hypothetical protein